MSLEHRLVVPSPGLDREDGVVVQVEYRLLCGHLAPLLLDKFAQSLLIGTYLGQVLLQHQRFLSWSLPIDIRAVLNGHLSRDCLFRIILLASLVKTALSKGRDEQLMISRRLSSTVALS